MTRRRGAIATVLTRWPIVAVVGLCLTVSASCGGAADGDGLGAPGWGQPEVLGRSHGYATLVGDGLGNAVAVWVPYVRTGEIVPGLEVRRFTPGVGWAPVEAIDSLSGMSFQSPAVAMDPLASIVVNWSGGDGLYATRFVIGRGWSMPLRISPRSPWSVPSPALKLDAAGNALAVWSQGSALWTNRFEPASGWRTPARLPESGQVEECCDAPPALAVNASGNALAIWAQGSQSARTSWTSSFTPTGGWSRQERLGPDRPLHVFGLGATMNASGHGLVLWVQQDPDVAGDDTVVARRYQPGAGFAPMETLGNFGWLAAGLDSAGNAVVFTIGPLALRVHRYTASQGWGSPELLDGVGGYDSISTDASGNGWILWKDHGTEEILSRRLVGGRAADPLAQVAPPASAFRRQIRVVADARGGAMAVWFETSEATVTDPEWTLMANRFLVP